MKKRCQFHRTGLFMLACAVSIACGQTARAELWFPPSLISQDEQMVADLAHFTSGRQLPGNYLVEVWLNDGLVATKDILFVVPHDKEDIAHSHDNTGLMACLTEDYLLELGVRPELLPVQPEALNAEAVVCLAPGRYIPQAQTRFDFQKMRLVIAIPQAALLNTPRGWIPPSRWDDGINAGMLSYNFSGNDNNQSNRRASTRYLRLNSGLNIGPWRLRDDRTWTQYDSMNYRYRKWQHGNTYLNRAITPLMSRLTLGDSTTDGDVFDSLAYRGVFLATDDNMYPDSKRGYAPVIRGTALSNASVSVRQNGYEVYRANVPPGDFVIDDLFPMYASGDLNVTVTESDGSTQNFVVPYSAVPLLLREGRFRYAVTAGKLRTRSDSYDSPFFVQGSLIAGLPAGVTLYSGIQNASHYTAATLGSGINMGDWGAISADFTHADSTLADGSRNEGQSLRFLYGRSLNDLGTTFQLTGYRYSTRGFYTLDEASRKVMKGWLLDGGYDENGNATVQRPVTDYYNLYDSKRQRFQANISQNLGGFGSMYLLGNHQTFWNRSGASQSLQAGFNSSIGPVSYSLSFSNNRTPGLSTVDRLVSLSLSVPLAQWLPGGAPPVYATASTSKNNNGSFTQQTGLSGSLLEQRNLSWNVSQNHSRDGGDRSNASLYYRGAKGNASLGYSNQGSTHQLNYGFSGGALLHHDGLTLSQPLGETNVLVSAPGAAGVPLENSSGLAVDWRGYMVRPHASIYRNNRVALDTRKLDDRTEIENAVVQVVPTRGAVVRADFVTHNGLRALFTLSKGNKPLPFGTLVSSAGSSGIVGDDGVVFLSGLPESGTVEAQWGTGEDQRCTVAWQIPQDQQKEALVRQALACQ